MLRYIDEIEIKGKALLIRADFNVPLDELGNITNDVRIRSVLPTIDYALDEGAKIILMSHMGRPKGKVVEGLSLKPVAKRLSRLLDKDVVMAPDCVGPDVERMAHSMKPGDVMILENLRFHSEETADDDGFAKKLSMLADIYVDDAFAVAHRAHASVHAITKFFDVCVAGFLMKKEITYFDKAITNPARPVVAILGGAKVSDKIGAIENLLMKVDKLIIGGAMASTFLAAIGCDMGDSKVEPDWIDHARELVEKANKKKVKLYLPVDTVVAEKFDEDRPGTGSPRKLDGPRYRSGNDAALRRGAPKREDDHLERPHGGFRNGRLFPGHPRDGIVRRQLLRPDHRWGRRYRRGGAEGG
jgi:phosphoglycerate kinase